MPRFEEKHSTISQQRALAGAIRYSLTRWDVLTRCTRDDRLDISNNAHDRAIRPLAIGGTPGHSLALKVLAAVPLSCTLSLKPPNSTASIPMRISEPSSFASPISRRCDRRIAALERYTMSLIPCRPLNTL